MFSPGASGLYAARIISGLGIGALSVTGTVSIVEIAPAEIRGLLSAWYSVCMGIALMTSTFCVYGMELHIPKSHLQYQVVWFSPCIFMALWIAASFILCESPRWLVLSGRDDEALSTLVKLRQLPGDHPRVQAELLAIKESIRSEGNINDSENRPSLQIIRVAKETFTKPSNIRRVQQALIMYALPQFSGGNSVTNYFVPILEVAGLAGDSTRNLFLSGMYTVAKFIFSLFASFLFIDALGRRNSLFTGIIFQMASDIYLAVYIKVQQDNGASYGASQAGLAAIFIHAFGYAIGKTIPSLIHDAESLTSPLRTLDSSICFRWWAMAQQYSLLRRSILADIPLAIPLCDDICIAVSFSQNKQLGCICILRSLVCWWSTLCIPVRSRDCGSYSGTDWRYIQWAVDRCGWTIQTKGRRVNYWGPRNCPEGVRRPLSWQVDLEMSYH